MAFQRVCASSPYTVTSAKKRAVTMPNVKGRYATNNNVYVTSFTYDDLYYCLYGYNKMVPVALPSKTTTPPTPIITKDEVGSDSIQLWCDICKESHRGECPMHGPLHSLRKLVNADPTMTHTPYAVKTLPDEFALCTSSIPGELYGVCAKQRIPVGAWIGPFEGEKVSTDEIKNVNNTKHLWEVYNDDGEVDYFVNGANERTSSWMRYIRCARSRREQNLCVVQYNGIIYYRVCREIHKGMELLVWYDDRYTQFMGIPISLTVPDKDMTSFPSSPLGEKGKSYNASCCTFIGNGVTKRTMVHRERADSNDNIIDVKTECDDSMSPASDASLSPNGSVFNSKPMVDVSPTLSNKNNNTISHGSDFTDWNMWRCGQCFKTFTQRIMLQMHICPKNPDKPYQCGHCPSSFAQASELRNHVVTHSNERPFKCGFCGRAFAGATTLNNHIRTHTGEKPFRCDKCDRSFTQASQLSRHQRTPSECNSRQTPDKISSHNEMNNIPSITGNTDQEL
ncbi:PR domain containing 6-like protein [Saccoglossus kowalevskii]|uniref:PR domain containing 6-like protein n=1 Tax=Saccoglossus kowalevskii TaxID=10224 RepID=D1LXB7_SACKO|nr:PR domain containing 6-like protein [Saccoglossus kowalevskii]ACY92623.1 PR domain containing 6-like protein [Saccoglossus kowalevskii]